MKKYTYDIGIIGGGSAGLTVASGAAQLGVKTLLIEREETLGGDCLHYGCVPSKTLIKTAKVYHNIKNANLYGVRHKGVEPVDFNHVRERILSVIAHIQKHDSIERFSSLGVDVKFGQARFSDDHTVLIEQNAYTARKWVVATGSTAFIPPIAGAEDTPYLTNKDIFYLTELPQSLIVIGAGPIGIEMAQSFCRLGSHVTVIDMAEQILSKEDSDIAADLQRFLETEGIVFNLSVTVKRLKNNGSMREVLFETKDKSEHSVSACEVLMAGGRAPAVEGLGLDNIGVVYDRRGITVDARMRTSIKHIYAAGDCIGRYQFTHAAGYEGGIVLSNAIFNVPRKANYTNMPWCTYSDPELASIGMNEKAAKEAGVAYTTLIESFSNNDRALAEGESNGKIKMVLDKKERPLGVQILGAHAGELINEWVAVQNGNVRLSTVASAIHPYPTFGEINKRIAGALFGKKLFSKKVRKILKVLFKYQGDRS